MKIVLRKIEKSQKMSRILEIEFVHFAKCKSQTTSKNDLGKAVRLVRQTAQGPSALTPFQSSRDIDAYGVSGSGSAMPENSLTRHSPCTLYLQRL
ncbi:hypothetical protein, partial [Fibrobacter intestinalis]|uniref:hypothetical protein n=1 Tax=Fibrobacter intestinalis TaxID=28122 RepID=UPI001C6FCA66